jgi:hypothetical protein
MRSLHDEFSDPDCQVAYRSHKLGEAGAPLHQTSIINPSVAGNIGFGIPTMPKNYLVADCLRFEPDHASAGCDTLFNASESQYHRTKHKLGQVPDGVAVVPERVLDRGFGISTWFGETLGAIVQGTHTDVPANPRVAMQYQANRNYDWQSARLNPATHTFGDRNEPRVDHVTGLMRWDNSSAIIETAIDRVNHSAVLPDPNPLNPGPSIAAHRMHSDQLRNVRDPSERAPAGFVPGGGEFHIGDTFAGIGLMDSHDADYRARPRQFSRADEIAHGIPTPPNPFPNPLYGPGKHSHLGLNDEEFIKIRDRAHIVPVMTTALALIQQEVEGIYERVAGREGRDLISVAEFHDEFKRMTDG